MKKSTMTNFQPSVSRGVVYQSNPLIEAQKTFDVLEMRIFILGLQALNPHFSEKDKFYDEDFQEVFISTTKLTEALGNTWYLHELERTCEKMFQTAIKIKPEHGGGELSHLFRKLKYVPGEGLYIWFEELLRPYILDLVDANGYTRINVDQIFKLSSTYAIRLLELMLQYQNIREFKLRQEITREIRIDDLRFMLNVPEGSYRGRLNNFKKFVLDDPIREINTRTDYEMSYTTLKAGRRVVGFKFHLNTEHMPLMELNGYKPLVNSEVLDALMALGFTEKIARAIFAKCSNADDCFSRINRAQALLSRSKTPVKNRLGFLRIAIEQNWQINRGNNRRDKFEEFAENPVSKKASGIHSLSDILANLTSKLAEFDEVKKISSPKTVAPPVPEKKKILKDTATQKNKYKMPIALIQQLAEQIDSGQKTELVEFMLSEHGLTVEKFKSEFMLED